MVAQSAGVKLLVLTHLLAELDEPGVRERVIEAVGRTFAGKAVWGEDLMQITPPGNAVTQLQPN